MTGSPAVASDAADELTRVRSALAAAPDGVLEEIARRDHGMVKPGEQAFQIAPPAVAPVELPETWPFTGASDWLNR